MASNPYQNHLSQQWHNAASQQSGRAGMYADIGHHIGVLNFIKGSFIHVNTDHKVTNQIFIQ